jgi:thymidylate kinase
MLQEDDLGLFMGVYSRIYRRHPLPEVTVFLRVEPTLCLERVRHRMSTDPTRGYEAGLTVERLRRMEKRYEDGLERLGQENLVCDVRPDARPHEVAVSVTETLKRRIPLLDVA